MRRDARCVPVVDRGKRRTKVPQIVRRNPSCCAVMARALFQIETRAVSRLFAAAKLWRLAARLRIAVEFEGLVPPLTWCAALSGGRRTALRRELSLSLARSVWRQSRRLCAARHGQHFFRMYLDVTGMCLDVAGRCGLNFRVTDDAAALEGVDGKPDDLKDAGSGQRECRQECQQAEGRGNRPSAKDEHPLREAEQLDRIERSAPRAIGCSLRAIRCTARPCGGIRARLNLMGTGLVQPACQGLCGQCGPL